ncbi:MAG: FecR domain-containing protein, partial [Deltaproteobacteria bacterium]|nr:FecR domain-containing protein [Deltaproteobacteria bacterium]
MKSLDDIGENIDAHLGDGVSDFQLAEGRRRFTEEVSMRTPATFRSRRRQWVPLISLVGASVVSVIAVVVVVVDRGHVRRLESRNAIHSIALAESGAHTIRLETSRDQSGATVQLVTGAFVTLSRRTRGESRLVAPKSYRVRLDHGQMTFTIDPHLGATWTVEAGEYQVRVLGTIFTVTRDPSRESVEVQVERGRVEVSGGRTKVVTLVAGGTLRA